MNHRNNDRVKNIQRERNACYKQYSDKWKNIHTKVNSLDLFGIFFLDKPGKVLKMEKDVYIEQLKNIIKRETNVYFLFN